LSTKNRYDAFSLSNGLRSWRWRSVRVESKLRAAVDLVNELGLSKHVVLTGFIPAGQLGVLYRGATLFMLLSRFEGFGMAAVESLAIGTPTLLSDLPVLREVTFDGARYISDPLNERQLADDITQLLTLGERPVRRPIFCREISQRFAPETIARQYHKLLLGLP
jgi:glycosyltransferase involved in cell wall biosynthesis